MNAWESMQRERTDKKGSLPTKQSLQHIVKILKHHAIIETNRMPIIIIFCTWSSHEGTLSLS